MNEKEKGSMRVNEGGEAWPQESEYQRKSLSRSFTRSLSLRSPPLACATRSAPPPPYRHTN